MGAPNGTIGPRAGVERPERTVLPVAVLVAVLGAVVVGGYAIAGALSSPAGPPVDVAGVVRVFPLSGWELAGRFPDVAGARLTRGSGTLDVVLLPSAGSAEDLLRLYVDRVLERTAEQLSVSGPERAVLESGLEGSRISFVGTFGDVQAPVEGQVTAVPTPSGVGVVFSVWAPSGLLRFVLGDVDTMIDRAQIA